MILLAKTNNAAAIRSLLAAMFKRHEIDFKKTIEANLCNKLIINELDLLIRLSFSSFKKEFVKHCDHSPAKYIKLKRLD